MLTSHSLGAGWTQATRRAGRSGGLLAPALVGLLAGMVLGAALLGLVARVQAAPHSPRLPVTAIRLPGQAALLIPTATATLAPSAPTPLPTAAVEWSDADEIPQGAPVRRSDWVITKDYRAHGGFNADNRWGAVDFAFWGDPVGEEIIATQAGLVHLQTGDPVYGNTVYVLGRRYSTVYNHILDGGFVVAEGAVVHRGDLIAHMGSTGASTGPHVDYQVWHDDHDVDPLPFVNGEHSQ